MAPGASIYVGHLIDGTGGPIRRRCLVCTDRGRIARIDGDVRPDALPAGTVDFSGGTLVPGLVDSHIHLFLSATADPILRRRQLSSTYEDLEEAMGRRVRRMVALGIVAARDGGDSGGFAARFRDRVLSGQDPVFRLAASVWAWHKPGRYGAFVGRTPDGELAEVIDRVHERLDCVKIINSGTNSLKSFGRSTPPQFTTDQLTRAVCTAARLGLSVMVHANGRRPVAEAIEAGCQSIEHGFFMGAENLARMAEARIVWVPTAVTMAGLSRNLSADPAAADTARRCLDHLIDQFRQALRLGVPMAAGTDAGCVGVEHGVALQEELGWLMAAGMPAAEAIRAASVRGAGLCGGMDVSITPDRPATFVLVGGTPEAFPGALGRVRALMVRGKWVFTKAANGDSWQQPVR